VRDENYGFLIRKAEFSEVRKLVLMRDLHLICLLMSSSIVYS